MSDPYIVLTYLLLLGLYSVSCYLPRTNSRFFSTRTRPAAKQNVEVPSSDRKNNRKYEQLLDAVEFHRSNEPNTLAMRDDPLLPMVNTVIEAASMRKANSMSAFRISHITEITTFMVIIEGNSRPQNQVSVFVSKFMCCIIHLNRIFLSPPICRPSQILSRRK